MPKTSDLEEDSKSQAASPVPDTMSTETQWNKNIRATLLASSSGIIGSFFLPWIKFILGKPSGFDLQQLPTNEAKLLWLIPVTAVIAFLASLGRKGIINTNQLAGVTPYFALMYYYCKLGCGLLEALQVGAYITLGCGAVLLIAPRLLKRPT
jgi:hypothetical protein